MANSTVLEVKKKREPFVPPDGWVVQAFQFALDLTDDQRRICARQWGGRRYAYNWTLRTIKTGVDNYNATGVESEPPSFYRLRKQWNVAKDTLCVGSETGEMWWPAVGKEAFADGVRGAVEGYWNWQRSKSGNRKGRKMGFPRFKKKGRDQDRFTITTGVMRLEPDRRHLSISKLGCVRTHENTRKIERLVTSGRARILAVTVRWSGSRAIASLRVIVARPQQPSSGATSVVGVDVGVRTLATVANAEGRVLERVANPTPLANELSALRRLNRQRSRRQKGSRQYRASNEQITRLHHRIRDIRVHHIHNLTTRLAKTHGTIVVEGLDAAGMLCQKGLNGARARRRGLADAALAEPRRQLRYKCSWYGSQLIEADRFFPSSKTCHTCGHVQDIGWARSWTCDECRAIHDRDDNAAINLARWPKCQSDDLGGVAAPVKHGAVHKTGPRPAAGVDMRKSRRTERLAGATP